MNAHRLHRDYNGTTTRQHRKPCRECPFRRASAPGYLGNSSPLEFQKCAASPTRMPCHLRVDYERKDWKRQAAKAPQCVGRAILTANICKRVDDPLLLTAKADRVAVFSHPLEMLEHHRALEADLVAFIVWQNGPWLQREQARAMLEQWRERQRRIADGNA